MAEILGVKVTRIPQMVKEIARMRSNIGPRTATPPTGRPAGRPRGAHR